MVARIHRLSPMHVPLDFPFNIAPIREFESLPFGGKAA